MLTREEQSDLIDLTWHRETAYTFSVVDGTWTATPADNPAGVLTAESAVQLRENVQADYAGRQVSLTAVRGKGCRRERAWRAPCQDQTGNRPDAALSMTVYKAALASCRTSHLRQARQPRQR